MSSASHKDSVLLCFGADHTHRNEFLETAFDLAIAVDPERQEKKSLRLILIGSWAMSLALTLPMVLRTSGAQDPRKTAITQNLKTMTKAMK